LLFPMSDATNLTPDPVSKITRFWQELKRRNIVRRNTVYAATAYVILELISIITEPFGLPEWTMKLVVVLLIIGFIVSLILSWNYDFSPEGLKKTELAVLAKEKKKAAANPAKRKLKASDVVIAVLAIAVGVLAYPRIFTGSGNLNAMTRSVTVYNEYGEKEIHEVFKEDYLSKLALFPFTNESKDSSLNWLEFGIYEALGEDLEQFSYLSVDWNEDVSQLNEQIKRARTNHYSHFLTGTFTVNGGAYEINSRLYKTENGSIQAERVFRGKDFFILIDSMSLQARKDLGISNNVLNSSVDLPFKAFFTDNLEAFEYFVKGNYVESQMQNLNKAIELDSTFAMALITRAYYNHMYQLNKESAQKDISQAMRFRQRLTENREINSRILYYSVHGESNKAIALAEMQHELQSSNVEILAHLIEVYWKNFKVQKLAEALLKLNELVPDEPAFQLQLAESYLLTGKPDKGIDVLEKLLEENPENTDALLQLGELYLHKNDLEAAEGISQKAILFNPEEEEHWSRIFLHFEFLRNKGKNKESLESMSGYYRFEGSELGVRVFTHNNHLLGKGENQTTLFLYPISDSVFISYDGFFYMTFVWNQQNVITKFINEQRNVPDPSPVWKEDSLILNAAKLLDAGQMAEALQSYQKAYQNYPDHYYLANYIQHIEFTQSPEYLSLNPALNSLSGTYDPVSLHYEGKHLYYKNPRGFMYKLLPLSENSFMVPERYSLLIHVVKEQDKVTGLNFVWRDGSEEFDKRTN